jgi:GWxTD domain-containing protein
MNRALRWVTISAALIAANLHAQVSQQYTNWGNTAVRYLMMKQEKADWAAVKTDAGAQAFVELFWARRDPTPDTPVNELREQFEQRIAEADKRFGFRNTPGSQTDQGLVYVLFGEPTQIVTRVMKPAASTRGMAQFQRPINVEQWIYRGSAAERVTGTKAFDVAFEFHDETAALEFELEGPSQKSFESDALGLAKSVLKRPFLTNAVPLRIIVVADIAAARDILRRAQEGENFADLARRYSSHHSAQQGGYIGRFAMSDLSEDFASALAGKEPGATVMIARSPQFAVVRVLTEAEARAADAEMPPPPK